MPTDSLGEYTLIAGLKVPIDEEKVSARGFGRYQSLIARKPKLGSDRYIKDCDTAGPAKLCSAFTDDEGYVLANYCDGSECNQHYISSNKAPAADD